MCLRSGDQDTQERSYREGRAQSRDGSWEIETSSAGLRGLSETEHLVCRTAESDDSTRLGVSGSPNDLSSPMEAMSGGSPGTVALPLQFRSTSPGLEIRTGSQNTSLAGWVDPKGADVQRNLLIEGAFSGVEECPLHALQFGPSGQLSYSGSAPGSLATIDDGSTSP